MGQISVEIPCLPGSVLNGNQHIANISLFKLPIDAGFDMFLENRPLRPATKSRYESSLTHIIEFCDANNLTDFRDLTWKMVFKFVAWRKKRGNLQNPKNRKVLTDSTIRRDLLVISSAWDYLCTVPDWKECMPPSPVTRTILKELKEPKRRVRCATKEEWAALLSATTTDMHRAMLTIAVETGLRLQELLHLTWNDVDFDNNQILVVGMEDDDHIGTKTGETRVVPLTVLATDTLKSTVRSKNTSYVFWHAESKGKDRGKEKQFTAVKGFWKGVIKRSKVTNFRFHDIRHTFASNFANKGGNIYVLQKLLGHSTVETTERYGHLFNHAVHEEMARINRVS